MNGTASITPSGGGISECEHLTFGARQSWTGPSRPVMVAASAALLRTISEVLDIRSVFPRVSEIVQCVLPHDALELVFHDRSGHVTLEATSTDDLKGYAGRTGTNDEAFQIVSDLRHASSRVTRDVPPDVVDHLVAAGYRSFLNIRCVARHQVMGLGFFAKHPNAYGPHDVVTAQFIADYVALAVAHEQMAVAEQDQAEARRRAVRLNARVRALADKGEPVSDRCRMVGRSEAWQRVLTKALRVASTETTVFLEGESGTGKEVLARFIYRTSPRRDGPFIAINCAGLPEQLFESELFGYERGAFTGAQQAKAGQIELAARGVLFLDEVSELSLTAQAKFLRFLQEREFQRLGGTRAQKANVRVIAASNRDLHQALERGTFREDLFYRLQVFDIQLPPLRDRAGDLLLLAEQFLEEFGQSMGRPSAILADDAREALLIHTWPGNVRELRNVLERAAILSDEGVIERRHLSLRTKPISTASPNDLAAIERQAIENALRLTDWNKSKTARQLGLTRTQLYVRLRRYDLENSGAR